MSDTLDLQIPWPGWRAVRRLGRGAYGSVWEIDRDVQGFTERCALKVVSVPPDDMADGYAMGYDEDTLSRNYGNQAREFVKEYQLEQTLGNHPNVVACQDVSISRQPSGPGWDVYIRMELLTPLTNWIGNRSLSWREVAKIGRDVANALAACETRDIVHRDVKPQNILIDKWGNFKLGDFGVARTMEGTRTATVAGTETYMAPEILRHERYDRTVDIYSLGLVMFWALNGYRLPFMPAGKLSPGDISRAESRRLSGENIPMPPDCPPELGRIVLRSCAYQQADRYQSARELLADLDRLLSDDAPEKTEKDSAPRQDSAAPTDFIFSPASGVVAKGEDFFKGALDEPLWDGFRVSDGFFKIDIAHTDTLFSNFLASPVTGTVTNVDFDEASSMLEVDVDADLVRTTVIAYVYQDSATVASEERVREGDQVRAGDRLIDIPSPLTNLGSVWLDAWFHEGDAEHSLMVVISEDAQLTVGQPVARVVDKAPSKSAEPTVSPETPTVSGAKRKDGATVARRAHAKYDQSGTDLRTSLFVVPSDRGGKVAFEGPDGRTVRLAVPLDANDGMTLRIRGLGVRSGDGSRGSLYVKLSFSSKYGRPQHEPSSDAGRESASDNDVSWGDDGGVTVGRGFGNARGKAAGTDESVAQTVGADWSSPSTAQGAKNDATSKQKTKSCAKVAVGSLVTLGSYRQSGDSEHSDEPFFWRVLAVREKRVLLISEHAIDVRPFNVIRSDGNAWETSDLKRWLQGKFAHDAGLFAYADGLTLLSAEEAARYLPTKDDRKCKPTLYAVSRGAAKLFGACNWWLRSTGSDGERAAYVDINGDVRTRGYNVDRASVAVRPALWIDL